MRHNSTNDTGSFSDNLVEHRPPFLVVVVRLSGLLFSRRRFGQRQRFVLRIGDILRQADHLQSLVVVVRTVAVVGVSPEYRPIRRQASIRGSVARIEMDHRANRPRSDYAAPSRRAGTRS